MSFGLDLRFKKAQNLAVAAACVLCAMALCVGCRAPEAWDREEPEIVLKSFLQIANARGNEIAWKMLSEETKKKVTEAHEKTKDGDRYLREHPWDMLRYGHLISSTREYKKLEVVSNDGKTAVVNIVRHDASAISVVLTQENGRWTIDLPINQKDV